MRGRWVARTWKHDPRLYAPARYRRACRYRAFLPDGISGIEFALDARIVGVVSDAEEAVHELNARDRPALAPLERLLLRTESVASSRVEGMQIGIRELARAEARAEGGGRPAPTAREVLANVEAMRLAIANASTLEAFSVDRITHIHERLLGGSRQRATAGRIRTVQNWIGGNDYNPCGADFVPPPPEAVGGLLSDLCAAVEDESLSPLVQAALVHAQFETIHPFDDGNGRTGRAIVHVVLRRRGLAPAYVPPISVALAHERERYIDGLVRYREGDLEGWIEHFAAATARSAQLASTYLDEVDSLTDVWRSRLAGGADPRADAAAWAVIDVLPAHPVITAPLAQAATGRAKAAVHQAMGQLEDAGVLERMSGGRRNRSWEAAGLLDLIAGLEAGQPPGSALS